uniref:Uncharacterized protein n=1 Tax=Magallana gigas TaxID=29159 RepID=K1R3J4_MAGGI
MKGLLILLTLGCLLERGNTAYIQRKNAEGNSPTKVQELRELLDYLKKSFQEEKRNSDDDGRISFEPAEGKTDMLQPIRIWPVMASGLKTLGESDVAGAGRPSIQTIICDLIGNAESLLNRIQKDSALKRIVLVQEPSVEIMKQAERVKVEILSFIALERRKQS